MTRLVAAALRICSPRPSWKIQMTTWEVHDTFFNQDIVVLYDTTNSIFCDVGYFKLKLSVVNQNFISDLHGFAQLSIVS